MPAHGPVRTRSGASISLSRAAPCHQGRIVNARLLLACGVAALSGAVLWSQAPVAGQAPTAATPPASAVTAKVQAPATRAAAEPDLTSRRALVDRYCVTCHNARLKTANLLLDQLDLANLGDQAEVAEKVVRRVRAGLMPPTGMKRPGRGHARRVRAWMEDALDRSATVASARPRPAPPESHRVRQRDSRPAGARGGRHEVPAAGRLDARLRQHRRRADDVAGADGGVPVGGRQDQPAGDRHVHGADAGGVRRAGRHRAEPSHRRAAVRHARRHADQAPVPGRRRVQLQREGRDRLLPGGARRRAGRAARGHGRRRAREAVRLGQGDLEHDRHRQGHAADPDQGGPAHASA